MSERLLQFIWQHQYFNTGNLRTTEGESIQIIQPGVLNSNQGPDFLFAKILIGKTEWVGTVELHLKSSDWIRHEHQLDANYGSVILHVVWTNDLPETGIPILELDHRVSQLLLQRYEELMLSTAFIPCEKQIAQLPAHILQQWQDELVIQRLKRKSSLLEMDLKKNNYHWQETFWHQLARNFGSTVNADAFETMARSIPVKLLSKYRNQLIQLESLLFGQSGLLHHRYKDAYAIMEQKEYKFLRKLHQLCPIALPVHFLRMRPGNFPTIRLAQLAMVINTSSHLFSKIRECNSVNEVRNAFAVTANDYWHYHYRFDECSTFKPKKLGDAMTDNIIINTIAPMLYTYGEYHQHEQYKIKALQWLRETKAENNRICNGFVQLGVVNNNAFESQALYELKTAYCVNKRCLECAIGKKLLDN